MLPIVVALLALVIGAAVALRNASVNEIFALTWEVP